MFVEALLSGIPVDETLQAKLKVRINITILLVFYNKDIGIKISTRSKTHPF